MFDLLPAAEHFAKAIRTALGSVGALTNRAFPVRLPAFPGDEWCTRCHTFVTACPHAPAVSAAAEDDPAAGERRTHPHGARLRSSRHDFRGTPHRGNRSGTGWLPRSRSRITPRGRRRVLSATHQGWVAMTNALMTSAYALLRQSESEQGVSRGRSATVGRSEAGSAQRQVGWRSARRSHQGRIRSRGIATPDRERSGHLRPARLSDHRGPLAARTRALGWLTNTPEPYSFLYGSSNIGGGPLRQERPAADASHATPKGITHARI